MTMEQVKHTILVLYPRQSFHISKFIFLLEYYIWAAFEICDHKKGSDESK
jgi:hypothetical protein